MIVLNKDQKTRDSIIFSIRGKYLGGCRRFDNLTLDKLKKLIKQNFIDPNSTQNESPTVKEFMDFAEKYSNSINILFIGYTIDKKREDYRVSIEGFTVKPNTLNCFCTNFLTEFVNTFRCADEFELTSDYARCWYD